MFIHLLDWSLVYVVIVAVLVVVALVVTIWSLVYTCRKGSLPCKRLCQKKRRRLHRYSPLADPEIMRMSTKGNLLFDISIKSKLILIYSYMLRSLGLQYPTVCFRLTLIQILILMWSSSPKAMGMPMVDLSTGGQTK